MSNITLISTKLFNRNEIKRLQVKSLEKAESIQKRSIKLGIQIVTPEHANFPERLKNIFGIPAVLYVLGDIRGLDNQIVLTMVGTRFATQYGIAAARKLSNDLALTGCIIVSGLAAGVDFACHEGALAVDGKTIGFLACGFDIDYPAQSNKLKRKILDKGALITEFPLGTVVRKENFHIRNRLLAGIAVGVVIVQAPKSSGALITARHALAQNRDVFAVPGDIFDISMEGCNSLIAEGAKMVQNVYSILEEYVHVFPETIVTAAPATMLYDNRHYADNFGHLSARKESAQMLCKNDFVMTEHGMEKRREPLDFDRLDLSEQAKIIIKTMDMTPNDTDEIAAKTKLSAKEILTAVTELEILELIEVLPGKRYLVKS